jgi:hypothetical protein
MHAVDPVSIGVFLAAATLVLAAFSAGYVAGKDAADTDDADDEAAAEDGTSNERSRRLGRERAVMVFAPSRRGVSTKVATATVTRRSGDISAEQLLADLRKDRATTLKRLQTARGWRVVTPSIPVDDMWEFIETAVSVDGTIDLGATQPQSSAVAPIETAALTTVEVMVLITVITLAAGALGFGVGYAANDNEAPGGDDDDTDGGDTGDTGDDGGAGAAVVATPILRNGPFESVNVVFTAVADDDAV